MGTPSNSLALAAAFLFCAVITDATIFVKQENSLFGPYEAGKGSLFHWDLTGSAQVADNAIRLTPDEPEKNGAIWNNFPVHTNDWEFHMHFHVHGKGVHLNGDGFAFWYVRDPLHLGPVFGNMDYYTGLAIFIDTVEDHASPHNHKHPYISAMINNGSLPYYHDHDGTWNQVGGCHVPVRNLEWPTKMAISYISDVLTVFVDTTGTQVWHECFRVPGVHLPTGYFFGLSASTGEYSDNHDIVSVTVLNGLVEDKVWEDRSWMLPYADHIEVPFGQFDSEELSEEQLQHVEEVVKVEVKREAHKPETFEQVVSGKHEHAAPPPEVKTEKVEHKTEGSAVAPASLLRKAIYIGGAAVILWVAITVFKKYSAQRRERMQKRLY